MRTRRINADPDAAERRDELEREGEGEGEGLGAKPKPKSMGSTLLRRWAVIARVMVVLVFASRADNARI